MRWLLGFILIVSFSCQKPKPKVVEKTTSVIEQYNFYSDSLKTPFPYHAYLPANYEKYDSLPVLYLLHGHNEIGLDWFHHDFGDMKTILDTLIGNQHIPPLVAIAINAGNSWYVDSKQAFEWAYINEFMPFIEQGFPIKRSNKSRLIAGNSAGGFGALRFGLRHPQLFDKVFLLSPAAYDPLPPSNSSSRNVAAFEKDGTFNDSIWQSYSYKKILADQEVEQSYPEFYMASGDNDPYNITYVLSQLYTFFDANGISNRSLIVNGRHEWPVYRKSFAVMAKMAFEPKN